MLYGPGRRGTSRCSSAHDPEITQFRKAKEAAPMETHSCLWKKIHKQACP